jgi:glycosidase
MFATQTVSYRDNRLLATATPAGAAHFDPAHPFYRLIAQLAALRNAHPALARGRQVTRGYGEKPGLFSVSRFDAETGAEYLIAFNTSAAPIRAASVVGASASKLETFYGTCPASVAAPGSVLLDLPAFGSAVCRLSPSSSPKMQSPQ